MINYKELEDIGHKTGFTHIVPLDCKTIELLPEVRQMCQADTCHMYEKNWSCPPGCGSLEECRQIIGRYTHGIIVQTVGGLEDELDGEGMMETEHQHKSHFYEMEKILRQVWPDMLAVGADAVRNAKPAPIRMLPAVFRENHFLPWKPTACLSLRFAREII